MSEPAAEPYADREPFTAEQFGEDLVQLITGEVARSVTPVQLDTDLLLSGLVDSLGVVRIVHWIEARFNFEIDAADVTLENFQTVRAMVDYVSAWQGAAA